MPRDEGKSRGEKCLPKQNLGVFWLQEPERAVAVFIFCYSCHKLSGLKQLIIIILPFWMEVRSPG